MKKLFTVLFAGLLCVSGCTAKPADKPEETPIIESGIKEADLIVVGSGISGLTAALSAAENGASVIVIEKQSMLGGTTLLASGALICVESDKFKDADLGGLVDSLDVVREFWAEHMSGGHDSGYPDQERWELVMSQTGKTVDWLEDAGVQFNDDPFTVFQYYMVANAKSGGVGLIEDLRAACEKKGVEIIKECKGEKLITDEQGVVIGITATKKDGSEVTFKSSGVILATGGIGQNPELVAKYSPRVAQAGTISYSAAGSTGDGLIMALEVGAVPFDEFFTAVFATAVDPAFVSVVREASTLTTSAQLGVNALGERFASENAAVLHSIAFDMLQDGNAPFWYIFDSSNEENKALLETGAEAGVVAKGETIEALAEAMGVDAAALRTTFDHYAELTAAGEDTDYQKAAEFLINLDQAPYYAVKFFPTSFGSTGGIKTDEDGRALNDKGEAIKGLYAVGEMSNRYYYNENYAGAASLGLYSTTGKIAGAAAAADIK